MGFLGRLFNPQCGVTGEPVDDNFARAVHWGPTGWRPMRAVLAPQQIGVYGDVVLTQRFKALPGIQRRSLGGVSSAFLTPDRGDVPYWQRTVRPGNVSGGQRFGSSYPGGLTPWTASQMRGQLVRAQVAQSGLSSVAFTKALLSANMAQA